MLLHVEKLRQLRAEIDKGIRSLDAGKGKPLDVEDFLRQQNERHGRSQVIDRSNAGGVRLRGGWSQPVDATLRAPGNK